MHQEFLSSELVVVSIGQCGVQLSNAMWELFCIEHGISPDGQPIMQNINKREPNAFFFESSAGEFVPRALCCDLEPTVIDEIRTGAYRSFYNPKCLLNVLEDGASNYARGSITVGKSMLDNTMRQIRRLVNNCDHLQGFLLISAMTGGTGAGFTHLLSTALSNEYAKTTKVLMGVFPGTRLSNSVVDPYNCIFSVNTGIQHIDVNIQFDNESCYNIAAKKLSIQSPTYTNINRMLSQVASSVTCSLRFENCLYADLVQLQTNTVPFPSLCFPTVSYAPYLRQQCADHQKVHVMELTRDTFLPSNMLVNANFTEGKYMAVSLQYRGNCNPQSINEAIIKLKQTPGYQFVDWCPTGYKIGICSQPSVQVPNSGMALTDVSVCSVVNHTRCVEGVHTLAKKFDAIFNKRAFVHAYIGEGMEEGEFQEARDKIDQLLTDYAAFEKSVLSEEDSVAGPPTERNESTQRVSEARVVETMSSSREADEPVSRAGSNVDVAPKAPEVSTEDVGAVQVFEPENPSPSPEPTSDVVEEGGEASPALQLVDDDEEEEDEEIGVSNQSAASVSSTVPVAHMPLEQTECVEIQSPSKLSFDSAAEKARALREAIEKRNRSNKEGLQTIEDAQERKLTPIPGGVKTATEASKEDPSTSTTQSTRYSQPNEDDGDQEDDEDDENEEMN